MKRTYIVFLLGILTSFAFGADGYLGTKSSGTFQPVATSAIPNGMAVVQMVIAVGIVYLGLKVLLPKLAGKVNKRINTSIGSRIKIEESATFAGGSLQLVEVCGKTLLLSVTGGNVQCLADVTEGPKEPAPLTFQEILKAAPTDRIEQIIEEREVPIQEALPPEVAVQLSRIEKLFVR